MPAACRAVSRETLPAEAEAEERAAVSDRVRADSPSKPEKLIQTIIEGRMKKYYEDIVLLEQPYILEDKVKVTQVVEQVSAQVGAKLRIVDFAVLKVGEGSESAS